MSRIFSVLSVLLLMLGLTSSALGVNYHVDEQSVPTNVPPDRYFAFFWTNERGAVYTGDPGESWVLPSRLGSEGDPDTRLILHNDDGTAKPSDYYYYYYDYSGYGNGPRTIVSLGNVTIESNIPGVARRLSATNTALFVIENSITPFVYDTLDPLAITYNYGGTLTISPDVVFSGTRYPVLGDWYVYSGGVIHNGSVTPIGTNSGLFAGVPFLMPGSTLVSPEVVSSRLVDRFGNTAYDQNGSIIFVDQDVTNVYSFLASNTLNAENVRFSDNETSGRGTLFSSGTYAESSMVIDDVTYRYYDTAIALNKLDGAIFRGNRNNSGDGGAISSYNWSYTEANATEFTQNRADDGSGGAIYAYQSILEAQDSRTVFLENHAAVSGGAIASVNSALYLKGANFRNNSAQEAGGAIHFSINDGLAYDLVVGAYTGSAEFLGNLEFFGRSGVASNSIVFDGSGTPGAVFMRVDVDHGVLNMSDPMRVETGAALRVDIEKTGAGTWNLGGNSNMQSASLGTQIAIKEGIFRLNSGATLNLTHVHGWDYLRFDSGSTFTVGVAGSSVATGAIVATTHLSLAPETTMRLNDSLRLDITGDASVIASTLSGSGNLTKTEAGTLTFSGTTSGYSGNVNINEGTFAIAAGKQFETTSGSFNVGNGATLSLIADANRQTIRARQVDLTGALIEIVGVSGSGDYVLVKSDNPITGDPTPIFNGSFENPDYLEAQLAFRNSNTELLASIGLAWDNPDSTKSHGTFTVHDTKTGVDFTVGTELQDKTSGPNWDGKSLTKKGQGTLELLADNSYSGETVIENGTLLLSHAGATGTGTSAIQVDRNGTLALDFQYGTDQHYDREIAGDGKVLKQGDSTVKLTNPANDYKGGTEIQGGTLQFDDARVFGTGALTFSGGALENTKPTELTQDVVAEENHFAWFNTPDNLTVSGGITGDGGLRKTGSGTLKLTGTNPYEGITRFEQGAIAISQRDNIGRGELVFDGGTLQNTGNEVILSNRIRLDANGGTFGGAKDTNLVLTGTIHGNGKLVQNGDAASILTLNGINTYSGGTEIVSGTIAIDDKESLGSGRVLFAGGILKNTTEINGFSKSIMVNSGHQAHFDVDEHDMSLSSSITGSGGLLKTGNAILMLNGNSDYTGQTVVGDGALLVNGSIRSNVKVENNAVLGGTGTIHGNVNFDNGSIYRWDFNRTDTDSFLYITKNVTLNNTYFQPVTAGDTATYPMDVNGWTVLQYDGKLLGDKRFLIDDSLCPFIDIALDYDSNGLVKLVAHNRHDPRPLSDVMATSLMMAQRKMNRRAFEQIDNELRHGRYSGLAPIQPWNRKPTDETRGQAGGGSKNLWGGLVGRTSNFDSTYYTGDQWRLNSWGVQTGYSFLSTNWISLGVTAGADLPQLKNAQDKVDGTDGHIGLYYGQRFFRMWELKGFIGGGLQSYKLYRRDAKYLYRANFHGDSFQTNIELAKPVLLGSWMLRPYLGFDLEYASQAGAVESDRAGAEILAEYRSYSGTSLTQLFLRCGLDFEKQLERGDFLFGIEYANMIGGQSVPSVYVYYPFAKKGVVSRGAELGHNVVSLHLGGNRYVNQARTRALFVDYTADIFCDRAGGASQHNFAVGFTSRF